MTRRASSSRRFGRGVTILDVARRAGVSTATVSRAIANPELVSDTTRSMVSNAIAETGYTPNASARNLRVRSTKMVLALVPGMTNTFFTPILNAIEDVLSEAGYGLIIGDTRNSSEREAHYARLVRAGQVDGVVLLTGHLLHGNGPDDINRLVPTSLVCIDVPRAELPVFQVANRDAARTIVDYLIVRGHRRIGHITGPKANLESAERIRGYKDALKAVGVEADERLIWPGDFMPETGSAAALSFLALAERPTAVFAANDETAVNFIRTVEKDGVRVPDDVSVVGFDDIEYLPFFSPGLTTMRQPRAELGRLAAIDLLQRMQRDAPQLPPVRVKLDCQLIERDSVRDISGTLPRTKPFVRRGAAERTTGASKSARIDQSRGLR
jgi:LacI family repressor for deo operon, udp, cdd, tsx, nupC, and nupG